jgi:hypothetical protein
MISYGWKLVGTKDDAGDSATAIPALQTDYATSSVPRFTIDGYSYVQLALLHTNASGAPLCDVYGTNYLGESSQTGATDGTVMNVKLATITGNAAGVTTPAGTIPGVDVATEWSSINGITDIISSGDGEMLGLMSSYAGYKGSVLAKTGTVSAAFESLATEGYVTITGSDAILGSVIIPCSLFASLQFDLYATASTDDVSVIACAFG